MNVKDIASQSSVIFGIGLQRDWKDPIYEVHVFPGSSDTV